MAVLPWTPGRSSLPAILRAPLYQCHVGGRFSRSTNDETTLEIDLGGRSAALDRSKHDYRSNSTALEHRVRQKNSSVTTCETLPGDRVVLFQRPAAEGNFGQPKSGINRVALLRRKGEQTTVLSSGRENPDGRGFPWTRR